MFRHLGIASLCLLMVASTGFAQNQPILEVRTKSLKELTNYASYLGDILGQDELTKTLSGMIQDGLKEKAGLEGIDPGQPFGIYGFMTEDVVDSPVMVLVPIKDQNRFINMLGERLNLDAKKAPDGSWQVRLDALPEPIEIRFKNDYAYVLIRYGKSDAAAPMLDPKEFFKTPLQSAMHAKIHVDQIPESVLRAVIANAELKVSDAKREADDKALAKNQFRAWALQEGFVMAVQLLRESQSLELVFHIDPKMDQLSLDLELTPKAGSALRKQFVAIGQRPGLGGVWLNSPEKQLSLNAVNLALGPTQKKSLSPILDRFLNDLIAEAPQRDKKGVRTLLEAIKPTLQAGEADFFYRVMPRRDKQKSLALVAGLKVVQGRIIEEAVKKIDLLIPENEAKLSFDLKKVGDFNLHKVELLVDSIMGKLLGNTLWLGISDNMILLSAESEPTHLASTIADLKSGLKPTPLLTTTGSNIAAMDYYAVLPDGEEIDKFINKIKKEIFGENSKGKDELNMTLTATDKLKLSFVMNGKIIKFYVALSNGISNR